MNYKAEVKENNLLNKDNIMGIDLGVVHPFFVAFNNSENFFSIKGGEIEQFRTQVEKRRSDMLAQSKYCGDGRTGHGFKLRIRSITKINTKISRFRHTCNHKYSRYLIDLALKNQCGTIQMEDLSGINETNKFLKNWSYYDLQSKIKYKAKENGIIVKMIKPKYTSLRCHKCGYINSGNRLGQATFKCVSCGMEDNADLNAAKNIATPNIEELISKKFSNN